MRRIVFRVKTETAEFSKIRVFAEVASLYSLLNQHNLFFIIIILLFIIQFKITSLSYLISNSSIIRSHSITCANLKHVSNFKEKLQLQKDAGPGIRNSFERITALGLKIGPGGPNR